MTTRDGRPHDSEKGVENKVKDIDQLLDQLNGLKARVEKLKECL
jgi:hypothetical protein